MIVRLCRHCRVSFAGSAWLKSFLFANLLMLFAWIISVWGADSFWQLGVRRSRVLYRLELWKKVTPASIRNNPLAAEIIWCLSIHVWF